MGDLEGIVKELVEDYVDDQKKPETIEEFLKKNGFKSLTDVKRRFSIVKFLGLDRNVSIYSVRRELFERGYLRDLPLDEIINSRQGGGSSPYLDPKIVGGDMVEEHHKIILQSQEFKNFLEKIELKYLDQLKGSNIRLASLIGVNYKCLSDINKKLFEYGFLTELPIQDIIDNLYLRNRPNHYLDPKMVGEEKVKEHKQKVLDSKEFKNFLCEKYSSLCDIQIRDQGLSRFFGTDYKKINDVKRRLFENLFFTEIPIQRSLEFIGNSGVKNPYLDPTIVGKEMVENYRVVFINSKEFKDYLESLGSDLSEIDRSFSLGGLLGLPDEEKKNIIALRKKLYELGFFQQPNIKNLILSIEGGGRPNPYIDPKVVGNEKVQEYKNQAINSQEFAEYAYTKYSSLSEVKDDNVLSNLLGLTLKVNELRKTLFELNLFTGLPINEVIEDINRSVANPYLDKEIVEEMAETYKELILRSPEFANYINSNFETLLDIKTSSYGLRSFFGIKGNKINQLRKKLYERKFLTGMSVGLVTRELYKKNRTTKRHPYLDPEIVGEEDAERNRQAVISSPEFERYVNETYDSLNEVKDDRNLAFLLGTERLHTSIRQALVERGFFTNSFSGVVQDLMESYTHG